MARNRRKSRKKEKPQKQRSEDKQAGRAKKKDALSWIILLLALVFLACMRFAPDLPTPWREILTVVQFSCPVAIIVLLIRAYPHPIRMMNQKLARERRELERNKKKKKRKKF